MILKIIPLQIFLPMVLLQNVDPNCYYSQQMVTGQKYYLYNKEFPNYYTSAACEWDAIAPTNTKIILTCNIIDLPKTSGCVGDKLAVSLTGNTQFADARTFCGNGSLTLQSQANYLTVGLFSASGTHGGRISCQIMAVGNSGSFPTTNLDDTCQCGYKKEPRIVGGAETRVNEYPMMAGIIRLGDTGNNYYCGGTIINRLYVVTAGHCVHSFTANQIAVLVGDHDITQGQDTKYSEVYRVGNIRVHEQFNINTLMNDIALIRVQDSMQFNVAVGPACLPVQYKQANFYDAHVVALGWGTTDFLGENSDVLREAQLRIESCVRQSHPFDASKQICTFNSDQDTCQYDSGGPVLWEDPISRKLYLIGIISYGGDCNSLTASFNTRVTNYVDWITTYTTDSSYCLI